ncbi:hypothetical protein CHS0354_000033 [Potamilus streckersoni]|uniref:Uncharacterized protein n=1 Tax=Potamilus streckersoni TaxID=2493646 RepID=A0AAE0VIL3_9BIVA|nr:hypothetical protein CHS0354_000033 [Potamilus streckersoni]
MFYISANSSLSSTTTLPSTTSTNPTTILTITTIVPNTASTLQGNYDLRLQLDLDVYLDSKDIYEDSTSIELQSMTTNFSVSVS